jgi:hypothetical protein
MVALCVYLSFNLGQYVREIIVNLDVRRVQVTPENTVRAGKDTSLHEINGLVTAADMVPCSGTAPDEVPLSFAMNRW